MNILFLAKRSLSSQNHDLPAGNGETLCKILYCEDSKPRVTKRGVAG